MGIIRTIAQCLQFGWMFTGGIGVIGILLHQFDFGFVMAGVGVLIFLVWLLFAMFTPIQVEVVEKR